MPSSHYPIVTATAGIEPRAPLGSDAGTVDIHHHRCDQRKAGKLMMMKRNPVDLYDITRLCSSMQVTTSQCRAQWRLESQAERLLRGARETPGRAEVERAAVSWGGARVAPRSFPRSSSPRGEDRLGQMVRRQGVLGTQDGSEVDALAEYGLSALNPGHTSTTHMMVRRQGVLGTQEGSEGDALAEYGLSALNPGHTSTTHMDTNTKSAEKALRALKARLPPRPDMPSKKGLAHVVMTTRKVWMKGIPSKNVFSEDIFSGQKVHLSRPLMSRHLNKGHEDLEKPSDDGQLSKKEGRHIVVRQHRNNESEAAIVSDPPQNNRNIEMPEKYQKKAEEFGDFMDMTEEAGDEAVQKAKDRSLRRRFANWLNEKVKERNQKKIARTYLREDREGHLIYSYTRSRDDGLVNSKMTKGEREQMKRNHLLWQEKRRQRTVESMNKYWAEQRDKKEALRLKEEQRYEQWAAKVGLSSSGDEAAGRPKKRMTQLEKAALGGKSSMAATFDGSGTALVSITPVTKKIAGFKISACWLIRLNGPELKMILLSGSAGHEYIIQAGRTEKSAAITADKSTGDSTAGFTRGTPERRERINS
ncbi:unnamed protein product [Lota lota]